LDFRIPQPQPRRQKMINLHPLQGGRNVVVQMGCDWKCRSIF
jgi:hypothetical protein